MEQDEDVDTDDDMLRVSIYRCMRDVLRIESLLVKAFDVTKVHNAKHQEL